MHDPMTVAFEIRWPIPKVETSPSGAIFKYHQSLITIWHNDPESDGSDDSCGWFAPKPSEQDRKLINEIVEWDLKFPYFSSDSTVHTSIIVDPNYEYRQLTAGDSLGMVAAAWGYIARKRDKRHKLTTGEWWHVVNIATNPNDNLRAILSDPDAKPKARAERFLWCVMRAYLRYHRPWYKHPRWHLHHWSVQCHPLQNLKRWLFSRCAGCGKRFSWGYSPTTTSWSGGGPRWFRGESNVYHSECCQSTGLGQATKEMHPTLL